MKNNEFNKEIDSTKLIVVNVKLISIFSKYKKSLNDGKINLNTGDTVGELIKKVGLNRKQVGLVFINGKQKDYTTELFNGDTVFLPPKAIGGG